MQAHDDPATTVHDRWFPVSASLATHLYVRVHLRPRGKSDLDEYYYEFEDRHPAYARYTRGLQISLGGAATRSPAAVLGVVF